MERFIGRYSNQVYALMRIVIGTGGEKALMYAFVFFFIASRGAGTWSLSRAVAGGRE